MGNEQSSERKQRKEEGKQAEKEEKRRKKAEKQRESDAAKPTKDAVKSQQQTTVAAKKTAEPKVRFAAQPRRPISQEDEDAITPVLDRDFDRERLAIQRKRVSSSSF